MPSEAAFHQSEKFEQKYYFPLCFFSFSLLKVFCSHKERSTQQQEMAFQMAP